MLDKHINQRIVDSLHLKMLGYDWIEHLQQVDSDPIIINQILFEAYTCSLRKLIIDLSSPGPIDK